MSYQNFNADSNRTIDLSPPVPAYQQAPMQQAHAPAPMPSSNSNRSLYIRDSMLDEAQIKILNQRIDSSFIVQGCAGSGKSLIALWKAKYIQDSGAGSFVIVVFTNALRLFILSALREMGLPSWLVTTSYKFLRSNDRADFVIIDEAQDFDAKELREMVSRANKASFLFGDSAQQLYRFRRDYNALSMEEIQRTFNFPVSILSNNYRLTKLNAKLATQFNVEDPALVARCVNDGTIKPKILSYESQEEQYQAIISIIKNRFLKDVAILFRRNEDVTNAQNYFISHGLNVEIKSNDNNTLNFNSSNPKLMTMHSAKGLQFEAVFIPDLEQMDLSLIQSEDEQKLLYVAMTRSYSQLYLMYVGELPLAFDSLSLSLYESSLAEQNKRLTL